MANLHLFSSPGRDDISDIVQASRPYLESKDDPIVAYLPLASLYAEKWLEINETAFKGLARFQTINAELMPKTLKKSCVMRLWFTFQAETRSFSVIVYMPAG